eukprot:CAMPEP_0201571550 /NCGR_PEP_ID=MMETSP0190_2-20130828/14400_1 /ASSEMBLY_ACC=CAM_ASM_000263 /TAXON_ID=37353 /ORGANISM="Rosalina sp." /LENGTH=363 /DNA_ID=CAMNT_0047996337 /DNA_START=395 /DNA_END=1486 /DNA_ORIENTATION=+
MATESDSNIIPPPPTLPDGDNKDAKAGTTENNGTEPPRKRMKVDQPQVPHYNSHNIYSKPTTLPSNTQQQPTSLPIIHEPVTPLQDDTDNNNHNNNNHQHDTTLFGAEVAPLPEPAEKWPLCAYCGKDGDLSRCSSCRQAYYCNRECQVAHWDVHSIICQPGPPQPPQLPDMSGGNQVPQPTTTYNYNNYNRSPQQTGYSAYNGYGHHPPSQPYGNTNGISHGSAHSYEPRPTTTRRRRSNYYSGDNEGNKEQYYCEECDRYFKNGQALGGHRSRVHSSRRNGNHDPNLPPDHRPRKRRARPSRARHEPSGDGQYVCPHCGREFATGNALGGHISGAHTKKSKRMAARNAEHARYARPRHPNI